MELDKYSEQYDEAFAKLTSAIREFQEAHDPGTFLDGFVLVTHVRDAIMEQAGATATEFHTPPDQAVPLTLGMLKIAATDLLTPDSE